MRAEETIEDPTVAAKTHTATKMLSIFRQLEEKNSHEQVPTGPKPLKCFTPPPEPARGESESEGDEEGSSEEDEEERESETEQSSNVVRAVDKPTDEFLIQVSSPHISNPKMGLTAQLRNILNGTIGAYCVFLYSHE